MRRERVVFWLGEASPHLSSVLRAVADLFPRGNVVGVFQEELQGDRYALGWQLPDAGQMEAILSPSRETIEAVASSQPDSTVHIFGGLRLPLVTRALRACARTTALIGLCSEARDWRGGVGALRLLHSRFIERPYRNRIDFVLAIGHLAERWYQMCGYSRDCIFPWAYVVEHESFAQVRRSPMPAAAGTVIVFAGQCIRRKGVDILLKALSTLRAQEWQLSIVGDGDRRAELERLAGTLNVSHRVAFLGVRPNAEVRSILGATDLLVLPSRFDGWGAVVNEALMSGVPVVCSDHCGAADLVRGSGHGGVFEAGSVDDLAQVLRRWVANGSLSDARRAEIREWSRRIGGASAARYFLDVIAHVSEGTVRPVAPWLDVRASSATEMHDTERIASSVRTCG